MLDIFEITFFGLSNSNVANTVNNESRTVIARRFFTSLPADPCRRVLWTTAQIKQKRLNKDLNGPRWSM